METSILEDMGLSRREAKTYLALLGLGPSTIGAIVKKAEIPSSKIYEILDRLMAKGLVSYVIKKHQKNFQAADPEAVLHYFNEKKEKFEELLPKLKEAQLLAVDKQTVELYEGRQAVTKMMHHLVDSANKGDECLGFSPAEEHENPEVTKFYTNLTLRRKEKGLDVHVLADTSMEKLIPSHYSKELCKITKLKTTDFNYPRGITILNDTLVTISWGERPTAVVMKSKHIAEQYRKFFYELYNKAKPFYK